MLLFNVFFMGKILTMGKLTTVTLPKTNIKDVAIETIPISLEFEKLLEC